MQQVGCSSALLSVWGAEGVKAKSCLAVLRQVIESWLFVTRSCSPSPCALLPHSQYPSWGRLEVTLSTGGVRGRCYRGHPKATRMEPGVADPRHTPGRGVPEHQLLHPWPAHIPSAAQPPRSHAKQVRPKAVPHWPDPTLPPPATSPTHIGFCSCSF